MVRVNLFLVFFILYIFVVDVCLGVLYGKTSHRRMTWMAQNLTVL